MEGYVCFPQNGDKRRKWWASPLHPILQSWLLSGQTWIKLPVCHRISPQLISELFLGAPASPPNRKLGADWDAHPELKAKQHLQLSEFISNIPKNCIQPSVSVCPHLLITSSLLPHRLHMGLNIIFLQAQTAEIFPRATQSLTDVISKVSYPSASLLVAFSPQLLSHLLADIFFWKVLRSSRICQALPSHSTHIHNPAT